MPTSRPGARLGYLYGYRRVFLVGLGLFGAASLACGLAPDPVVLVVGRVVQGIGGALAFPQVLTGIQLHVEEGPPPGRLAGLDLGLPGRERARIRGVRRHRGPALLLALLAAGGLGLGTAFSSILVHLTTAATPRYAADISGVLTTSLQIAGSIGVAAFGSLYLAQATSPGPVAATRAFGITTATFALVALIAAAGAHRAGRTSAAPSGLGRSGFSRDKNSVRQILAGGDG